MTSPEEEAYLTEETKKNLDLLHTPGSRIQSKGSGKERLVLGQMEGIFLLTVCTEPDGSQSINPIRLATINKVARVIAEGRDYTLTPQAQTEKSAPKEVSVNDFQVGGWIISASGSLRRIISIEGDAVTTLKRDGDTFR